jgi:hypothetical protein
MEIDMRLNEIEEIDNFEIDLLELKKGLNAVSR